MGYGFEAYQPLHKAGGMAITNVFSDFAKALETKERLQKGGVYQALIYAYNNPEKVGYKIPSTEWAELTEAYEMLNESEV